MKPADLQALSDVLVVQPSLPRYRRRFFELVSRQLDVSVVCSHESIDGVGSDLTDLACDVRVVRSLRLPGNLIWQSGLVGLVLRAPITTLVVNGNPRYVSSLAALAIARLRGVRTVWWGHAMSSTSRPVRAWGRMQLMRFVDRILLYYPEEIPSLPRRLRSRAVGIDNSLDTQAILRVSDSMDQSAVDRHRSAIDIGEDALIVTIGRVTEKAGVDVVLRALSQLRKSGRAVRLAVLGDGDAVARLRRQAKELGIAGAVYWVGPVYDEDQIAVWMKSAQVFAYGGAVGLSLVHAFSYALPAVISMQATDHNPEALLFRDGSHGEVFRKGEPSSLAAVLARVLDAPDRRRVMGQNAQDLVRLRLGVERMAEKFVSVVGVGRDE